MTKRTLLDVTELTLLDVLWLEVNSRSNDLDRLLRFLIDHVEMGHRDEIQLVKADLVQAGLRLRSAREKIWQLQKSRESPDMNEAQNDAAGEASASE